MPGASRAEVYFISAMMVLILILCVGAVYFFIKTYKKEMREKVERQTRSNTDTVEPLVTSKGDEAESA